MIRRTYVIQLRDEAKPESVRELVRVLEDAPQHIHTMRWSRVGKNLSRQPSDLIWDHGFEDRDGYLDYHTHPYHCNEIDDYMYVESPRCVVRAASSYFYDDEEAVEIEGHVELDDKWATAHIGKGPRETSTMISLFENVEVKQGKTAEYLALLRSEYLSLAAQRGMTLVRCWKTPAEGAGEELALLWDISGGWHGWDAVRNAFVTDPATPDLTAKLEALRTGGRRRLLEPVDLGEYT